MISIFDFGKKCEKFDMLKVNSVPTFCADGKYDDPFLPLEWPMISIARYSCKLFDSTTILQEMIVKARSLTAFCQI